MRKYSLWVIVSAFGISAAVSPAIAQDSSNFSLTWTTLDGGGGGGNGGGSFALNGTVGQPDAGAMSGGGFTLTGGFWSGVGNVAPTPKLSIRRGAGNTVILSWPEPSPGYVLEQTTNLNAGWSDVTDPSVIVGPNREVTLPVTGIGRLFRLIHR